MKGFPVLVKRIKMLIKRIESNRRAITKDIIITYLFIILQLFTVNYDHFVKTFIAHDGDKFTLPFSLLLRPTNKGEHGFYPVNSQTESITRVKCRKLKFLININIFRALCRESRRRSRRKDGYVALS